MKKLLCIFLSTVIIASFLSSVSFAAEDTAHPWDEMIDWNAEYAQDSIIVTVVNDYPRHHSTTVKNFPEFKFSGLSYLFHHDNLLTARLFLADPGKKQVKSAIEALKSNSLVVTARPDYTDREVDNGMIPDIGDASGDVNLDGKVNLVDAALVLQYVAGYDVLEDEYGRIVGDLNRDGKLNLKDGVAITRLRVTMSNDSRYILKDDDGAVIINDDYSHSSYIEKFVEKSDFTLFHEDYIKAGLGVRVIESEDELDGIISEYEYSAISSQLILERYSGTDYFEEKDLIILVNGHPTVQESTFVTDVSVNGDKINLSILEQWYCWDFTAISSTPVLIEIPDGFADGKEICIGDCAVVYENS